MTEERPRRILNPFAFPSETELRSVLLIWAIFGLCWGIGYFVTATVAISIGRPILTDLPSLERDVLGIMAQGPFLPGPEILAKQEEAFSKKLSALSGSAERDRVTAALSRLSKAAQHQLTVSLPYLFMPIIFLLLTIISILGLYHFRARRLRFARRVKPGLEGTNLQAAIHDRICLPPVCGSSN